MVLQYSAVAMCTVYTPNLKYCNLTAEWLAENVPLYIVHIGYCNFTVVANKGLRIDKRSRSVFQRSYTF